jgi:hypothetical protein
MAIRRAVERSTLLGFEAVVRPTHPDGQRNAVKVREPIAVVMTTIGHIRESIALRGEGQRKRSISVVDEPT